MVTGSTTKKAASGNGLTRVVAKKAPAKKSTPAKVASSNGAGPSANLDKVLEDPALRAVFQDAAEMRDLMETLKARRVQLGMSQQDIANLIGISQPTVGQAENGKTTLSAGVLQKYTRAVGGKLVFQILR